MSEQTFLVLTALAEEPLHGYAIVQAVEQLSEGRMVLRVGTLYGVLDRLVADGFAGAVVVEVSTRRCRTRDERAALLAESLLFARLHLRAAATPAP